MPFSGRFLIGHSPTIFLAAFLCFFTLIANNTSSVEGKICYDVDVRNEPVELEQLRNCTAIIGNLKIVLIERYNHSHFTKYVFPELREITGYLLLFRVFGIKSLRNLFPNLTIIRGERLMLHYALIIYEMTDLNEIGLTSLIKIQRGYVMIRYCPMLCYVHTINWEAITQVRVGSGLGNYLGFDSFGACPLSCPNTCPTNYCWNNKNCQLFETGKSNTIENLVCHKECLGGCSNSTASDCQICKHMRIMKDKKCVSKCPKNLYSYSSYCVDAKYCENINRKPILGECRDSCPLIISERSVSISAIEQCAKECPATEIDSLATSDLLRGCQIIKGDIYIRLQSGVADTMQILERNLGDIEEIEGILKVHRSPVITSLSFFKNLRIIRGNKLDNGKYTFILMSNENLQELWNFNEKKSLQLLRGNLLVHFNSKLCLRQIQDLQKILQTNTSADFISTESNGYEETCSAKAIITSYNVLNSTSVQIFWDRINITKTEKIVGFLIYYIVAPKKNVTHLIIDTCVQYGWQTHFIQNATDDNTKEFQYSTIISNLTQFTQYAYYVKTQVAQKEHEDDLFGISQGVSEIHYFKTSAEAPTRPVVETQSKTNTSITLFWSPMNDDDLIVNYILDIFIQPDEHAVLDKRNYCVNPRVDMHVSVGVEINPATLYQSCNAEFENWKIANPDSVDPEYEWQIHRKAQCSQRRSRQVREENQSQFINYLNKYKMIDCDSEREKCRETNRIPREIHNLLPSNSADRNRDDINFTVDLGVNHLKTMTFPNKQLNETFRNLLPYTMYIFQFFACNDIGCSSYNFHYERTESSIYADKIPLLSVSIDPYNSNIVHLDFSEPNTPNGLTVAFNIEKHDLNSFKITTICITRKQHYDNNRRYTFQHLDKGLYSFRVRAVSLASTGDYTDYVFVNVQEGRFKIYVSSVLTFVFAVFMFSITATILHSMCQQKRKDRHNRRSGSNENILTEMEFLGQSAKEDIPALQVAHHSNSTEVF